MFNEGVLLGFATAFFWGVSPLLYRWGGEGLSPIETNFIRNVGAFISVLFVNFLLETWDQVRVLLPLEGWVIFFSSLILGLFVGDNMFFKGLEKIGVGKCTVISSSYPIVTIITAHLFFGEKITAKLILACLAVISGIYLLYEEKDATSPRKLPLSNYILPLGTAISWGLSLALVKAVSSYFTPVSFMTWRVGSLLLITSFSILLKRTKLSRNIKKVRTWLILSFGGTLGIGVSYLAFIKALHLAPVSQIGVITATSPLITTLLASLFYKEKLGFKESMGSIFVVAGSILASV